MNKIKLIVLFILSFLLTCSISTSFDDMDMDFDDMDMSSDIDMGFDDDFDMNMEEDDIDIDTYTNGSDEIPDIITWKFEINMFMADNINKDILVWSWWELIIWANVDIKWYKIILNNASSLKLLANSSVDYVSWNIWTVDLNWDVDYLYWTIWELIIWTNVDIKEMIVDVKKNTTIWTNSNIENIRIKTNDINLSVNSSIGKWVVYVYGNFYWWINWDFDWKFTIYNSSSLWTNSDINWRFCALGKVWLWVNSDIKTYSFEWLYGNIYPIIDFNYLEDDRKLILINSISKNFDKRFYSDLDKIKNYNLQIYMKQNLLKKEDVDKEKLQSEINWLKSSKKLVKTSLKEYINQIFWTLETHIDENENNQKLYNKIKLSYIKAVDYENAWLVPNICNNASVEWNVNASYSKNGKIYIDWIALYNRKNVLNNNEVKKVATVFSKVSDEKLLYVNNRIDTMIEKYSKAPKSDSIEKLINILLDVKELSNQEFVN